MNNLSKEKELRIKKLLCLMLMVTLLIPALIPSQMSNGKVAQAATNTSKVTIGDFEGSWKASGYALGKSEYTAYLAMRVKADGSFSIYDQEAGNPGISGKMTVVDDDTISVECDSVDFDSPWPELQLTDELKYHFYNENQVRITYNDKSIVFSKDGKRFDFNKTFSGNWKQDHYKTWYTNNGINVSATYKLKLEGGSILLYRVYKEKEIFLTSFCGLSYNKKTNVVKTITELSDASKLPKNWRTMKEGRHFQSFKLSYNTKKHCLTLTFNKKSYSFYSNIVYGVKK
ncbi:MAG TPA: hypothetical protein DCE48_02630 [Lachnospiraceae bacterium]|uniref:hypothetical protein n=1 Tax=Anaerosporobacter sp. TaxID=1872529 RepID=UPI000EC575F5|nr:hypothetical protein [Anaerosporobacter sp.]HAB59604.1 hypothetical protein [Lachnospiraceae bacterium]